MPIWKSRETPPVAERISEQDTTAKLQKTSSQRDIGPVRSGNHL